MADECTGAAEFIGEEKCTVDGKLCTTRLGTVVTIFIMCWVVILSKLDIFSNDEAKKNQSWK